MNRHPAEDDASSLWRGQELPPLLPMPPQQLAEQATKLQGTVSRRNRSEMIAAVVITPVFLFYAWFFPHWLTKLGALMTVAGTGVLAWQLHRRASARPLPQALAGSLLAFHRGELVRQRDALRSVWLWYVAPIMPGMTVFLCGRQIENGRWDPWPFAIAALLTVGVVALNRYAARRLQRDIDALDQLTEETP
ncbi:MAG: hypothetical protein EOP39_01915 [Rubrivivax sp.]|nr:MAG: hypothetical protein EOP39_01915 [Rubrivivax sp.]